MTISKLENFENFVKTNRSVFNALTVIDDIMTFAHIEKIDNPQALIVGGCVRDLILGNKINDVDIATNVSVDLLEDIFKTHNIGRNKEFGLIVVECNGENIEVANFRCDDSYGNGRHPDSVKFVSTFKEDVKRRDFSINSLGLTRDGDIIDHVNGLTHLMGSNVQTVGDPNRRFEEDFLRMLRAVRFSTRLGFQIEENTFKAIQNNAHNIVNISTERITQELIKMASETGEKFANSLVLLKETGLLEHILPEIDVMDKYDHSPEHHPEGGVWDHTLSALRQHKGNEHLVNLGILFHDVGKPPKHFVDENGINRFFRHERKGFHMMDDIANRMKFDTKTKNAIKFATLNHMKFHLINKMSTKKVVSLMEDPNWEILLKVSECDDKSRLHAFNPESWEQKMIKIDGISERLMNPETNLLKDIKKIVNGRLVMKLLGITTGKKIGITIKKTVGWVIDNEIDINDIEKIEEFIIAQK